MSYFKMSGTVKVLSHIQHTDSTLGTTATLRKMRVQQPDGAITQIPYISGNGIRGKLRRVSAALTWAAAGNPKLSAQQFRVLYQGGHLDKQSSRISSKKVAEVREAIPHLALFGWSGGGRIIEGCLRVQNMIPLCDETAHITNSTITGTVWDRVDVQQYSRSDTAATSKNGDSISDEIDDEETTQMRFAVETITPGTVLEWGISLTHENSAAKIWLQNILAHWHEEGATVGGRSSAGQGQLDLTGLVLDGKPWQPAKTHDLTQLVNPELLGAL